MREEPLINDIKEMQMQRCEVNVRTIKICKVGSAEAFKKSGLDFARLRKGLLINGKLILEQKNL